MSVFGVILVGIFPHSENRENADQNNSEYGHFSRGVKENISKKQNKSYFTF